MTSTATDDSSDDVVFVEAQDGEALQTLFAKQCDSEGLMSIDELKQVPAIEELLQDGDLLTEELVDIWDAAPKFPQVEETNKERIDVDSFIQIYRDIDDLFEEDDDDEDEGKEKQSEKDDTVITNATVTVEKNNVKNTTTTTSISSNVEQQPTLETTGDKSADGNEDATRDEEEEELEKVFVTQLCDKNGLVTRDELRQWDEIQKLIQDGLLGNDEFDDLWTNTAKSPGSSEQLDVDGFLSFNVALDELFVFDDEDEDQEEEEEEEKVMRVDSTSSAVPVVREPLPMVTGDDLPPAVLFAELANEKELVGLEELKRWGDLQDMLSEGDVLPLELQNIYDAIPKANSESQELNQDGFMALYEAIDDLFETVDDEDGEKVDSPAKEEEDDPSNVATSSGGAIKKQLLDFLTDLNSDVERLPCGLESSELEEQQVFTIVNALETEPSNVVRERNGVVDQTELAGDWELLYSSSSAFKFNKGLSGLGGSFPNGQFGGLVQKLQANKYLTDMEYVERIEVNPSSASFDVRVNGDWSLRGSVSLFTGEPSLIMRVVPDRVMYGPTSTRADHWKSLGPLNQLDMTYLDDDLRIMRGSTTTETIFVFRRF